MNQNYYKCKPKKCKQKEKSYQNTPQEIILNASKAKENEIYFQKNVKKICSTYNLYKECVLERRPLSVLRKNAMMREEAIRAKRVIAETVHNAFRKDKNLNEKHSLIELGDLPVGNGDVATELRKPTLVCSRISVKKKKKKKKAELSLKQSCQWNFKNPLVLQEQLEIPLKSKELNEEEKLNAMKIDCILNECCKNCCCMFYKSPFSQIEICNDCLTFEEQRYEIPHDLEKHFLATVILGTDKALREPKEEKSQREPTNLCDSVEKFKQKPIEKNRAFLSIACIYVAYALTYEIKAKYWDEEIIDYIINDGRELHSKSIALNYKDGCSDFDIIPEILENQIRLMLCPPCADGILTYSNPNILESLTYFFNKRNACIFQSTNVFLLIWKQCQFYNIFDPNGRLENCHRDDVNGGAALIMTKPLLNVVHVIVNLSGLNYYDRYKLYEIRITHFQDFQESSIFKRPLQKKSKYSYKLNNYFTLVPAAISINQQYFPNDPHISIFISFIAILYSRLDSPKNWTRSLITNIIKFALEHYHQLYSKKQETITEFNIQKLPNFFIIGTFGICIDYFLYYFAGHIDECLTFKHSSLTQALESFFETQSAGLLQIENNLTLAVWCDSGCFYVFDPFPRSKMGEVIDLKSYDESDESELDEEEEDESEVDKEDEEEEEEKSGNACLHIHANLDSLCRVLYWNSLKMIKHTGNFFLHAIKILSIDSIEVPGKKRKKNTNLLQIGGIEESDLSSTPSHTSCSESEFLQTQKRKESKKLHEEQTDNKDSSTSIESENEEEATPEYDEEEIKRKIAKSIICMIMSRITDELKIRAERMRVRDSLTSLEIESDEECIPEYDNEEVAEETVKNIICIIMSRIAAKEEIEMRKARKEAKKATKKEKSKQNENIEIVEARRTNEESIVSNISDSGINETVSKIIYESLINSEDYYVKVDDKLHEEISEIDENKHQSISLEDELEIPSNFVELPDGNWIIFGSNPLKRSKNRNEEYKIAILASIIAAAESQICSIDTWNKDIIDFIMTSGKKLYENLEMENIIPSLLKGQLPKLEIDSIILNIKSKKLKKTRMNNLISKLHYGFCQYNHLMIFSNTYSANIFKRNNFFYLFIPYSCDVMGFRTTKQGKACFMRFLNLDALIRRINFNRFNNNEEQKFIVMHITAKKVSKKKNESDDDEKSRESNENDFIKEGIKKEQEKFIKFKQELMRREAKRHHQKDKKEQEDFERNKEDEGKEEKHNDEQEEQNKKSESEIEVKPKHKPGKNLPQTDPVYEEFQRETKKLGYHLCSETCLFKIQGTFALKNRFEGDRKTIRACFFTAIYAIMNAIVKPLSEWNFRRVDKVLEDSQELYEKLENKSTSISRQIKNVIVDEYQFHVKVSIYKPFVPRKPLNVVIKQIILKEEYFIIQLRNTSFAIHKDDCFHLFDPYTPSEKKTEENNKNSKEEMVKNKGKCPGMKAKTISDRDTASWILFADQDTMMKYIENRAASENWELEYRIHVIHIISLKKTPEKIQLSKQLLDEDEDFEDINFKPEDISCLKPEKIAWLDNYPYNVTWSQINKGICANNTVFEDVCKRGAYRTEIPNKVFSLWGNINPHSSKFKDSKGRQILAINVMACCMAQIYRFHEWNEKVLDTIVEHGDKYYKNSISDIKQKDYRIKLEDLDTEYNMNHINFQIHIEGVFFGILYSINQKELSLSTALIYLFSISRYGIIQCLNKCLAFGRGSKGYFLFDCQSRGKPLFKDGEEKVFVLWCTTLQKLLYCIILTLGVPYHNIYFFMYKIEINARTGEYYEESEFEKNNESKQISTKKDDKEDIKIKEKPISQEENIGKEDTISQEKMKGNDNNDEN